MFLCMNFSLVECRHVFLMCISFNIMYYYWVLKAQGLVAKKMGLSFIFRCVYVRYIYYYCYPSFSIFWDDEDEMGNEV